MARESLDNLPPPEKELREIADSNEALERKVQKAIVDVIQNTKERCTEHQIFALIKSELLRLEKEGLLFYNGLRVHKLDPTRPDLVRPDLATHEIEYTFVSKTTNSRITDTILLRG